MNSIVMVVVSVSLFLLFVRNSFSSAKVNRLAACMFGVYLIHDHQILRDVIWQRCFHLDAMMFHPVLWTMCATIKAVIIVFVGSFLLEWIRSSMMNSAEDKIRKFLKPFDDKFKGLLVSR